MRQSKRKRVTDAARAWRTAFAAILGVALSAGTAALARAATIHGCARAIEGAQRNDLFLSLKVRGIECFEAARMVRRIFDGYWGGTYGTHAAWLGADA